jgi:hypothetical protein
MPQMLHKRTHFNIFTMPCSYSYELMAYFYSACKFDCISGAWKVSDFIISWGSMPSNQTDFQILHWRGAENLGGKWARGCSTSKQILHTIILQINLHIKPLLPLHVHHYCKTFIYNPGGLFNLLVYTYSVYLYLPINFKLSIINFMLRQLHCTQIFWSFAWLIFQQTAAKWFNKMMPLGDYTSLCQKYIDFSQTWTKRQNKTFPDHILID